MIKEKNMRWVIANEKHYQKTKKHIFEMLGSKCQKCGIDDFDVLQLDHRNNDGSKYGLFPNGRTKRLNYTSIGAKFETLEELKKEYQLLCANCNVKKEVIHRRKKKLEKYGLLDAL